jgi:pyruvate,orthophosphate dikinase
MIEVPRAALTAGSIAKHADFFSFGTNDLTQTTFGFSRDDSASFMRTYEREGILPWDPFATLDAEGVGELLEISIQRGRATKPDLTIGICGEHGADPASIQYLQGIGINYVSCSPFRIPIAQMASAQAALRSRQAHETPETKNTQP